MPQFTKLIPAASARKPVPAPCAERSRANPGSPPRTAKWHAIQIAASRPVARPGPISPARAGRPVLQAKIRDPKDPLSSSPKYLSASPTSAYSSAIERYILDPGDYILRSDCSTSAEIIHLLEAGKKYLLGEEHGKGEWERQAGPWKNIPKMLESFRTIPREDDDKSGRLQEPYDRLLQPLESAHAGFLFLCLMLHNYLNDICTPRADANWTARSKYFSGLITSTKDYVGDIKSYAAIYEDYAARYERMKISGSTRLASIYAFALKLRKAATAVPTLLGQLGRLQGSFLPPAGYTSPNSPAHYVSEIEKTRVFIPDLADDLVDLAGITDKKEAGKIMSGLAFSFGPADYRPAADAADPARERTMAGNVRTADPPLLVQLGLNHMERVAKAAGGNVITVDTTNPDDGLEKRTRKS